MKRIHKIILIIFSILSIIFAMTALARVQEESFTGPCIAFAISIFACAFTIIMDLLIRTIEKQGPID